MARHTIKSIIARKQQGGPPLACLTAYTAPIARLVDQYADIALVGDSLGMVLYGYDSTVPVTLEMMIAHGAAVTRVTENVLVVVDMPFGSYQQSKEQAFANASRIMKETGCAAVKLEGGAEMAETVAYLTARGVAVMGHVGLQPQSVNVYGGYGLRGRDPEGREKISADAAAIADAGAFSLVIECTPGDLAAEITDALPVPVIGIGTAATCDGQILVSEDMLGFTGAYIPKFVRQYGDLQQQAGLAIETYCRDVREGHFPALKAEAGPVEKICA